MQSSDDILTKFLEPIMKNVSLVSAALGKDVDAEKDENKQRLKKMIDGWLEQYTEFRDGDFEVGDEDLIGTADEISEQDIKDAQEKEAHENDNVFGDIGKEDFSEGHADDEVAEHPDDAGLKETDKDGGLLDDDDEPLDDGGANFDDLM